MKRIDVLVVLWMVGSFAVGTVVFSPLNGAVLSLVTTFAFGATLRIQDIYE
jgi:hypothetical protein